MRQSQLVIVVAALILCFILLTVCCLCYAYQSRPKTVLKNRRAVNDDTVGKSIEGYSNVSDPYIRPYVLHNLLSPEMCREIITECSNRIGSEGLHDSHTLSGKNDHIRNSKQCWIKKTDPLVAPLYEYLSERFDIPVENAEDLQVVRYHPNQYYRQHHDACCDKHRSCDRFVERGGQRKLTVLIYLNDDFTAGETHFPNLNLKLKAKPGSAIVFHPLAENSSKCHPYALHEGLPVKSGEKWIANVWFRERSFST